MAQKIRISKFVRSLRKEYVKEYKNARMQAMVHIVSRLE